MATRSSESGGIRKSVFGRIALEVAFTVAVAMVSARLVAPGLGFKIDSVAGEFASFAIVLSISVPIILARSTTYGRWLNGGTRRSKSSGMTGSILVALTLVVATLAAYRLTVQNMQREANLQFERFAEQVVESNRAALELCDEGLRGVARLYQMVEPNRREAAFSSLVEGQKTVGRLPGMIGVGFVRFSPDAPEAINFEQVAHTDMVSDRSHQGSGLDGTVGACVKQAVARSAVVASNPIDTLGPHRLVAFAFPIYDSPGPPLTVAERLKRAEGAIVMLVDYDSAVRRRVASLVTQVDFDAFLGERNARSLILDLDNRFQSARQAEYRTLESFARHGQTWIFDVRSTPEFEDSVPKYIAGLVLGGGLAMTLIVFIMLTVAQSRRREAMEFADAMTDDVRTAWTEAKLAQTQLEQMEQALRTHAIMSVADRKGTIIDASDKFAEVSGYTVDELIGQNHSLLSSGKHSSEFWKGAWTTLLDARPWRGQVCDRAKDGALVWLDTLMAPIVGPDGGVDKIISVRFDVTESRAIETENRRLAMIARNTSDAIVVTDPHGRITWVNDGFVRLTGYSSAEIVGREPSFLQVADGTLDESRTSLREAVAGRRSATTEIVDYDKQGAPYIVRVSIEPVIEDGEFFGYLAVETDVSEERLMQSSLRRAAETDALTQLPNRNLFIRALNYALTRRSEGEESGFTVLFIDLDQFKYVNDSLGHAVGDQLLCEVGRRMADLIRRDHEEDVVAGKAVAARLGGDEFAILLPYRDVARVDEFATEILHVLQEPLGIDDRIFHVSASVGIADDLLCTTQVDELLRDADTAMYEAKVSGRNCVRRFDVEMRQRVERRVRIDYDLLAAIGTDDIYLAFQPIVDLASGRMEKVESLLRWKHPEFGMIPPDEFIRYAEESGAIQALGDWALDASCREFAAMKRKMGVWAPKAISVNLSRKQLIPETIIGNVRQCLESNGLQPHELHLEITETALISDFNLIRDRLEALKAIGVQLFMDDFGVGYSSLGCLRDFPMDVVKLDRSFTWSIDRDASSNAMIQTVIKLAHDMNLRVVAEGVETEEQRRALLQFGCDYGQGYLFSKPLTSEALIRMALVDDGARKAA